MIFQFYPKHLCHRSRLNILLSLLVLISTHTNAQITFGPQPEREKGEVLIRDLNWMNTNYLNKQRGTADQLTRVHLGRQLRKNRNDLMLLQKVLDKHVVEKDDKESLQALGAALGDVIEREHKKLNWKVYEDELGASHAVCLDDTEHCVFPMTMISRRVEAEVQPDVKRIFDRVLSSMKPYFPRLPYSRDQ